MISLSVKVLPSFVSVAISTISNWLCWELGNRFAEDGTLLTVVDGNIEHVLRRGNGADGHHQTLLLKFCHKVEEPRALRPETIRNGNTAVGEKESRRILAMPADFFDLFPFSKPGVPSSTT